MVIIENPNGTVSRGRWLVEDVNMLDLTMECTVPTCKLGAGGAVWKTTPMPADIAMQLLDRHRQDNHGTSTQAVKFGSRNRLKKIERPKLSANCTQGDFSTSGELC